VQRCTGALVGALVGGVGECCWWVILVLLVGAISAIGGAVGGWLGGAVGVGLLVGALVGLLVEL
jgi:hypothetical protein